MPAGTVFTWQQTVRITGISAWRIASRIWVDSGLLFPERNYGPIVNTSWSRWDRNDWNIGVRTDTKTRTVNITVPAGGFAPGETYFVGWTSLLMHSTFECEFIFTSSNPGTIEGDESVMFTPSPIIGCDVRNPDLADSTLLDSMNAEERAIVEEVARS